MAHVEKDALQGTRSLDRILESRRSIDGWCDLNFGRRKDRWNRQGDHVYLFANEEDFVFFEMTWC